MDFPKQISSSNGLIINFINLSSRYYGDFFNVRLEAVCEVQVPPDHEAAAVLGSVASYRRMLSKMAVPSAKVPTVIDQLIEDFERTTLPYMSGPSFPESLISAEFAKTRKKTLKFNSSYDF